MTFDLSQHFPRLAVEPFMETSPIDPTYNCIAWAAGESSVWWEPHLDPVYFWPQGLPRDDYSTGNYVDAFTTIGYQVCEEGDLEPGYEKIAIYEDNGDGQHATRQLSDGRWASKLGRNIDIEHQNADSLTGRDYGTVAVFMRRSLVVNSPNDTGNNISPVEESPADT